MSRCISLTALARGIVIVAALSPLSGLHAAEVSMTVTNADKSALSNAIVYAQPSNPVPAASGLTASVDQQDREFVPLVSAIQTGTAVSFPNSDNIRHQVYSFSPAKQFNLKLYSGKPSSPVLFDKPGVITLGCNIHDHMIAWVLVVDTPWYARTDATGNARLVNLPAGDYTIHTWHPGASAESKTEILHLQANQQVTQSAQLNATSIEQLRKAVGVGAGDVQ